MYDGIEAHEQRKRRFLAEYPAAKPVDKLLEFDNWQEYLHVYSQAAYPDLHLREEIVRQALHLGVLAEERDALSFSKQQVLDLIDQASAVVEKDYTVPERTIRRRQPHVAYHA